MKKLIYFNAIGLNLPLQRNIQYTKNDVKQ